MFVDNPVLEFNVILDGIPGEKVSEDVTVNFWSMEIDNKEEFWTDANRLEM